MSVREIAEQVIAFLHDDYDANDEDSREEVAIIESAIREAAKPLVEALEQIGGRGAVGAWEVEGALNGCVSIAEEALAAWRDGK